jgi:hypothetical protein
MKILTFASQLGQPITEFQSCDATALELARGIGDAHAFVIRFERDGIIGPHPAGFGQLLAPIQGSGWVAGPDGARCELRPGQAALIARGETHSKGSETGMTVLMIQVRDLKPVGS